MTKDDNELSLLPLRVMAAKERGEISADLARDILKGLSVETVQAPSNLCDTAFERWQQTPASDRGSKHAFKAGWDARTPVEPSAQRGGFAIADGTRDGDGVWKDGFWHPDLPLDPLDAWNGMASAPKDGTRILALVTEKQFYRETATPNELIPVVVRWAGEYQEWSMPGHGGLRPTLWLPIRLSERTGEQR